MEWATQRGPRPRLVATSHRLASCVIVSRFRTALDLDTYPLSNFIRPRCAERAKRGRGKPVLIIYAYWLFSLFSRHISRTQSFQQNRHIIFPALVALNLLVSLISRLVARSARIVVDKQTNKQTNRQTDTQNNYCNPRCECAPRVNYASVRLGFSVGDHSLAVNHKSEMDMLSTCTTRSTTTRRNMTTARCQSRRNLLNWRGHPCKIIHGVAHALAGGKWHK